MHSYSCKQCIVECLLLNKRNTVQFFDSTRSFVSTCTENTIDNVSLFDFTVVKVQVIFLFLDKTLDYDLILELVYHGI